MSAISLNDVQKLANLSALSLNEAELEKMRSELEQILGYVEQLSEVDTEGVDPTYQVTGLTNITRSDEVATTSIPQSELLKNTPLTEKGQIKVPRVLG